MLVAQEPKRSRKKQHASSLMVTWYDTFFCVSIVFSSKKLIRRVVNKIARLEYFMASDTTGTTYAAHTTVVVICSFRKLHIHDSLHKLVA